MSVVKSLETRRQHWSKRKRLEGNWMKILPRTIIKIVVSFTSFYHFDSFLQIKFFLSSSTPAWYNKKHNLYAFMEFSYTRQRIVNGTTTAHNDTLEEMKARKGATAAKKSLSFIRKYVCEGRMKNFITHSYCGIMNSFSDCFLLLCCYCLLESYALLVLWACSL